MQRLEHVVAWMRRVLDYFGGTVSAPLSVQGMDWSEVTIRAVVYVIHTCTPYNPGSWVYVNPAAILTTATTAN